jgi:hypothetical protein
MSIKYLLAAAELPGLGGSKKLALMAIADDADDTTALSLPGIKKVMKWSTVTQRRALQLIADLADEGYVESVERGFPGKRAVYRVIISKAAQPVDNSDSEPVDNSQIMGAESDTRQKMGANQRHEVLDSAPLSLDNLLTTNANQSVNDLTTESYPQASSDDDEDSGSVRLGLAGRVRRAVASSKLDIDQLTAQVAPIFDDVADAERGRVLYLIALRIIGKAAAAGTKLQNPTRYVTQSIQAEPEVWRKVAFELEANQ